MSKKNAWANLREKVVARLVCPDCRIKLIWKKRKNILWCRKCNSKFPLEKNLINLKSREETQVPLAYETKLFKKWQRISLLRSKYYHEQNWVNTVVIASGHRWAAEHYSSLLHVGSFLVDLGCGKADHLRYSNIGGQYVGIDLNESRLRSAAKSNEKSVFIVADVSKLPFRDGSLPLLVSFYFLEHVWNLDDTLTVIKRSMQKNGVFLATIPTEGGFAWSVGRFFTSYPYYLRNFGIDVRKVSKIEHASVAIQIERVLERNFLVMQKYYFPFQIMPFTNINATISYKCINESV